jgi:hypothetical protein
LAIQESIETFEKKQKKDKATGLPYNIVKTQCGGEDGLKEAISRGDVYKQMENGRERYYYHESSSSRTVGYVDKSRLSIGTKKLDKQQAPHEML